MSSSPILTFMRSMLESISVMACRKLVNLVCMVPSLAMKSQHVLSSQSRSSSPKSPISLASASYDCVSFAQTPSNSAIFASYWTNSLSLHSYRMVLRAGGVLSSERRPSIFALFAMNLALVASKSCLILSLVTPRALSYD